MGTERRKSVQNQGPDQLLDKEQELEERGPGFHVMGPQGPGERRPLGDCP